MELRLELQIDVGLWKAESAQRALCRKSFPNRRKGEGKKSDSTDPDTVMPLLLKVTQETCFFF